MRKSELLFVQTQSSRCGNCGRESVTWGQMRAAGRCGETMSAPDCDCTWGGWSSDYFHIDESYQDRFGFGFVLSDSQDAAIVEFPFCPPGLIDRTA